MSSTNCPICSHPLTPAFTATLMGRHTVSYLHCRCCGLLRSEEPYWLEEAYASAIVDADTGLVTRNLSIAAKLAVLLQMRFDPRSPCLDVAGGYGMLTRLMRDIGFDCYWHDKYCPGFLARGFEVESAKLIRYFPVLTAFEVLEHVYNPVEFVEENLEKFRADTLIFSTELYSGDDPPAHDWWYYAFPAGQHITFYQRRTLEALGRRLGMRFWSINGLHVLTRQAAAPSFVLKLCTGRMAPLLALLIRQRLGSRTQADHLALLSAKSEAPQTPGPPDLALHKNL